MPRNLPRGLNIARFAVLLIFGAAIPLQAQEPPKPTLSAVPAFEQIIQVDGHLNEAIWQTGSPAIHFTQQRPNPGTPAVGESFVLATFDQSALYIAANLKDPDPNRISADEKHRDASLDRSDTFAVLIDTYHDHQNGYLFETNLLSAQVDALIIKEGGQVNKEWDGLWEVAAQRTPQGWSVEFRIPLETIRFRPESGQTWGIQFRRRIPHLKEISFWSPLTPEQDFFEVSRAGHLVGMEALRQERPWSIKPYLKGVVQSDQVASREVGIDIRYQIRTNLTFDLTVNTDFAETDLDALQVNFTRFPLFFPEKREFFLEGKGFYDFGLPGRLQPYFSRRMGLIQGTPIPIEGGGKLTGKIGPYGLGALTLQTGRTQSTPAEQFSVFRFTRDMGLRSNLGLIATDRDRAGITGDKTAGVDATFAPHPHLVVQGFWVKSDNQDASGAATAGGATTASGAATFGQVQWRDPTLRLLLYQLRVDKAFDPKIGFVQQTDLIETQSYLDVRPHPATGPLREIGFKAEMTTQTDRNDAFLYRSTYYRALADFKSGHFVLASWDPQRESLPADFTIRPGITIPKGDYKYEQAHLLWVNDPRRAIAGSASLKWGGFYGGHKNSLGINLTFAPAEGVKLGGNWEIYSVALPQGSFESESIEADLEWASTTHTLVRGLIQWGREEDLLTAHLRFSWEYTPGAHLFIVANHSRQQDQDTSLLIAKLTYLWKG